MTLRNPSREGTSFLAGPPALRRDDCFHALPDLLRRAAVESRSPLVFVDPRFGANVLTYADLRADAARVHQGLRQRGLQPGEIVLLQLPPSASFFAALWGCFLGGICPFPLNSSSTFQESANDLRSLHFAWELADRPLILADRARIEHLRRTGRASFGESLRTASIEELTTVSAGAPCDDRCPCRPEDIALLLVTSGSTAQPKLVMLSHRNLVSAAMGSAEALGLTAADVNLNWMPFEHIGALAFHLRDVACGAKQVHVPVSHVLEDPLRLLDLLEEHSATTCWAPNFAFGLIGDQLQRAARNRAWNLSRVRVFLNGSEAIAPTAVNRFLKLLQPSRLSPQCVVPCWGMTETSAAVTYNLIFEPSNSDSAPPFIASGSPIRGVDLRVVDSQGQLAPAGAIGHIQIRGEAVSPGYWRNPPATHEALTHDGWRRTGDLGFLSDGQLTVTGREKTQIIIHGKNYSNQAIEAAAETVAGVSKAAAFATRTPDDNTDSLAIAYCRSDRTVLETGQIEASIRRHVIQSTGANPRFVFLLDADELPRSATGKIQYFELRARFEAGEYAERIGSSRNVHSPTDATPLQLRVGLLMARAVGREQIGVHDNFFDLGGDSLRAAQVIAGLREMLRMEVTLRDLFLAPTPAQLAACLQANSDKGAPPPPLSLGPIAPAGVSFLSPAQQRLWLLDQLHSSNPAYHVSAAVEFGDPSIAAFELRGPLDRGALEASLGTLADRHDLLRGTVVVQEGKPFLRTMTAPPPTLHFFDLQDQPSNLREQRAREIVEREHQRKFDFTQGPLWRAGLIQLETDRTLFYLVLHHLICDGWSVGVIRRELSEAYAAHRESRPHRLPPLLAQYHEYAAWSLARKADDPQPRTRQYWRDQLRDLSPTQFPPDRLRPPTPSHQGKLCFRILPVSLANALRKLCRQKQVTLFMLLLAAFKTLGARYLDHAEITVGSPVAQRPWPELCDVVGLFVNTVVLRTSCAGNPSFSELLTRVRETVLNAFSYQELPFEQLVEEIRPARQADANPLFDIMFALHNMTLDPLVLTDLAVTPLPFPTTAVRFDTQWDLWELPDGELRINAFYRQDLFDQTTVETWLLRYETLLQGIVQDPDRRVGDLSVMTPWERSRILDNFSNQSNGFPGLNPVAVHARFRQQAQQTPRAPALRAGARTWTYAELDLWSESWARQLRTAGVTRETVIAIDARRSASTIAAMLGILKAGGAYFPLDFDQPIDRLRQLLRSTGVRLVLAEPRRFDRAREIVGELPLGVARLPPVEDGCDARETELQFERPASSPHWSDVASHERDRGKAEARIDDFAAVAQRASSSNASSPLACVLLTSGTTRGARAVGVEHRGISRLVQPAGFLTIAPDDVFLQLAPLTFDAASFEIWAPLLHGARLVAPPPGPLSTDDIERLIEEHQVTVLWLTAGLFHEMARRHLPTLRRLRVLLAGGDVLSPSDVQAFYREPGRAQLLNGYGPTENTTFTTVHPIECDFSADRLVPIGRPIPGAAVYVLDATGSPTPIGVAGELYAGGAGVARGYLGAPADTADRFVPDPFSGAPGARLYRTGDLVRWKPDGSLEFLGRRDRQLKIQGRRIEPSEVESILREHASVQDAIVLARLLPSGAKQLAAFIKSDSPDSVASLRSFLRARAPEALIPHALVVVADFPLTAAGKVDHASLLATVPQESPALGHVAPRSETERKLADIWSALLDRRTIGVHESFFDLGGESLLAMQLASRINDAFRVVIPLRCIFTGPTVAELASTITQTLAAQYDTALVGNILAEVEEADQAESQPPRSRDQEHSPDHEA